MDQSTHDVRRANWFNIITECQQRPAGVCVRQWLSDNGIKEKPLFQMGIKKLEKISVHHNLQRPCEGRHKYTKRTFRSS